MEFQHSKCWEMVGVNRISWDFLGKIYGNIGVHRVSWDFLWKYMEISGI